MISAPSVQVTASKPGTDNPARVAELATDVRAAVADDDLRIDAEDAIDAIDEPDEVLALHLAGRVYCV